MSSKLQESNINIKDDEDEGCDVNDDERCDENSEEECNVTALSLNKQKEAEVVVAVHGTKTKLWNTKLLSALRGTKEKLKPKIERVKRKLVPTVQAARTKMADLIKRTKTKVKSENTGKLIAIYFFVILLLSLCLGMAGRNFNLL